MNEGPYDVVRSFEAAVAKFTGAPYCVAVSSCTSALFLCFKLFGATKEWHLPKRTYVGVGMSVLNAGARIKFRDEEWSGAYQVGPHLVWDAARRFRAGMWKELGGFVCTSHHWGKPLGIGQGGCILHDDEIADDWLRRARFDGRKEGVAPTEDKFPIQGWHMIMMPELAAAGLARLAFLPRDLPDLPWDGYPDLSTIKLFQ